MCAASGPWRWPSGCRGRGRSPRAMTVPRPWRCALPSFSAPVRGGGWAARTGGWRRRSWRPEPRAERDRRRPEFGVDGGRGVQDHLAGAGPGAAAARPAVEGRARVGGRGEGDRARRCSVRLRRPPGQLIPAGLLVTVPCPVPDVDASMRLPRAGGAEGVERALFGDRGAQFGRDRRRWCRCRWSRRPRRWPASRDSSTAIPTGAPSTIVCSSWPR